MQTLRGMLEQLLADRSQATAPTASPSPAPTAHSIPASAPQPPKADLLNLGVPAVTFGASSGAHNPAESRTVIIPTHTAPSGYRTPRQSRAMPPHNSWAVPPYQDPSQSAPQPDPVMSQHHQDISCQRHLLRGPKMLYDIKPRMSPHMVSATVR